MKRLAFIVVLLCSIAASLDIVMAQKSADTRVHVRFARPVTPSELTTLVRHYDLSVLDIMYEIDMPGNEVISGGYTLQAGEDIDTAVLNMQDKHVEFLRNAIDSTADAAQQPDAFTARGHQRLNAQFHQLLDTANRLTFVKLRVLDGEGVARLLRDRKIVSVTPVTLPVRDLPPPQLRLASSSHESWAPYYGTSRVTTGLTFQTFYFDNVSAFGSTSTYEHETQIYNKNFADYANYWASNMPNAYYDTPFLDTIDNFTVGTSTASSLSTYTQYWTHMALSSPGTVTGVTTIIKGQLGHRSPSWCYSTWCIWADATTSGLSSFSAPAAGTLTWSY